MTAKSEREEVIPGGFTPTFHWRVLGTPAPVFPGFEIDICDPVGKDGEPEYYNDLKPTRSFCLLTLQFAFGTRAAFNNEDYRNSELLGDKACDAAFSSIIFAGLQ